MPLFQIDFEILSEIKDIELIGKIKNPKFKEFFNQKFKKASWQYKKGPCLEHLPISNHIPHADWIFLAMPNPFD